MKNFPAKKPCRRFYGHGIPGVKPEELSGKLIVIEGADGSGRSTQIARLVEWLETCGHPTVQVGLKRSTLVSEELNQAQAVEVFRQVRKHQILFPQRKIEPLNEYAIARNNRRGT